MKDILEFILKNITTHPDDVRINESQEDDTMHLIVTTHPDDVGRVIGKEGKIIKAIRSIMRVVAIQKGERVRISVDSGEEQQQPQTQENLETQETERQETQETMESQPEPEMPEPQETPQEPLPPQEETIDLEL